jgi:hypothetical protein
MPVSSLRDQLRDLLLKAEMLSDGGELLNVIKVSMRNVHGRVMFVDETTVEFQSKEIREAAASGRRERRQEISYVRTETTKRSGGGEKRKLEIEEKTVSKQKANLENDAAKGHSALSEDAAVRSDGGGEKEQIEIEEKAVSNQKANLENDAGKVHSASSEDAAVRSDGGGEKEQLEIEEKAVSKQEANPEDDTGKGHSVSSENAAVRSDGGGKKGQIEIEKKAESKHEANPEDDTGKVHSASSEDAVRSFWGGKSGSDASANTSSYFYMVPVEKQTRRAVPFTDISSESSFLTATGSDSTASSSLISTMVDGKESTWRNPRPAPRLEEKTRCWTVRIGKVYGYEVSDGAIVVSTYSNPLNIAVESDDRNE